MTVRRDLADTAPADELGPRKYPRTRSPLFLLTLILGILLTAAGWGMAVGLDDAIRVTSAELHGLVDSLLDDADVIPGVAVGLGMFSVLVLVHFWTLRRRRFRDLAMAYLAAVVAALLSEAAHDLLEGIRPLIDRPFEIEFGGASWSRTESTDPWVAGLAAMLVMSRRSLPPAVRLRIYWALPLWLLSSLAIEAPQPYLGIVLDIGLGMVGASVTALVLKTSSRRAGPQAIIAGLAANGLVVTSIAPAAVDARGSSPWRATIADGSDVFIKALSSEQRVADLLFRLARWLRLRRSGDAPPETSLRRSAEHEAFLSHHARSVGVPTPKLLTVADLGGGNVALVYEAALGQSLDGVEPEALTDDILRDSWLLVRALRAHAIAHRDLRLANVFLQSDGSVILIDFGFAELAAARRELDTDLAEFLTATAAVVGAERAVKAAVDALGVEAMASASDRLFLPCLSSATRSAAHGSDLLEDLRSRLEAVTGQAKQVHEPVARLSAQWLVGTTLAGVGVYVLIVALADLDVSERISAADWPLVVGALIISWLVYPAAALAFRSACTGRVGVLDASLVLIAGMLPRPFGTDWSFHAGALSSLAERGGLSMRTSRRAATRWTVTAMLLAPILVAGLVFVSVRARDGSMVGLLTGVVAGGALALTQVGLLRLTSWGSALSTVWLADDPDAHDHADVRNGATRPSGTSGWWLVAESMRAASFVLVAGALNTQVEGEQLVAMALPAHAFAALTPAPGGLGAPELFLFAALYPQIGATDAVAVVVVARATMFWLHLPAALLVDRWLAARSRAGDEDTASRPLTNAPGRAGMVG